jgi:hypothetical protein
MGPFIYDPLPSYDGTQRVYKTQETESGSKYSGEFDIVNGLMDGRGKIIEPDGTIYEGYWRKGMKNGRGRLIYTNGDVYEGEFKENCFHGFARLFNNDGNIYEG